IYVTHDQVEAMSMGDRIVLMDSGQIMQADTPAVLYREPANVFSARFVGSPAMNIVGSAALDEVPPDAAHMGFRPEHAALVEPGDPNAGTRLRLPGTLVASEYLGAETIDRVRLDNGAHVSVRTFDGPRSGRRGAVEVTVPRERLTWFGESGLR